VEGGIVAHDLLELALGELGPRHEKAGDGDVELDAGEGVGGFVTGAGDFDQCGGAGGGQGRGQQDEGERDSHS